MDTEISQLDQTTVPFWQGTDQTAPETHVLFPTEYQNPPEIFFDSTQIANDEIVSENIVKLNEILENMENAKGQSKTLIDEFKKGMDTAWGFSDLDMQFSKYTNFYIYLLNTKLDELVMNLKKLDIKTKHNQQINDINESAESTIKTLAQIDQEILNVFSQTLGPLPRNIEGNVLDEWVFSKFMPIFKQIGFQEYLSSSGVPVNQFFSKGLSKIYPNTKKEILGKLKTSIIKVIDRKDTLKTPIDERLKEKQISSPMPKNFEQLKDNIFTGGTINIDENISALVFKQYLIDELLKLPEKNSMIL